MRNTNTKTKLMVIAFAVISTSAFTFELSFNNEKVVNRKVTITNGAITSIEYFDYVKKTVGGRLVVTRFMNHIKN